MKKEFSLLTIGLGHYLIHEKNSDKREAGDPGATAQEAGELKVQAEIKC
jgi:hypothetical protein